MKLNLKVLFIGGSGSGKTHNAATFEKCYFLTMEPGGHHTFLFKPELRKNVIACSEYDMEKDEERNELIPSSPQDTKRTFENLKKHLTAAKQMNKDGLVNTLVVDNLSFLAENRWIYIETYEKELTNSGAVNTQAMYGKLSRWLYQFVVMDLLTFNGNVIVNCHEQVETDEALDKKPDKSCPVLPAVLGGFRDKIEGLFSFVIYLNKAKGTDSKYHYFGRTNKGNNRNGKSRLDLPEVVEDISYGKLMEVINKAVGK